MAVIRVQKTDNYTVMSNHHLRNKNLSLKAKGFDTLNINFLIKERRKGVSKCIF